MIAFIVTHVVPFEFTTILEVFDNYRAAFEFAEVQAKWMQKKMTKDRDDQGRPCKWGRDDGIEIEEWDVLSKAPDTTK